MLVLTNGVGKCLWFHAAIVAMMDAGEASAAGSATRSPPCLVLERGCPTLREHLTKQASSKPTSTKHLAVADQPFDNRTMFIQLCESLSYLHGKGLVARRISAEGAAFFENAGRWRFTDFASWARRGDEAPLDIALRYAAPEVCVYYLAPSPSACHILKSMTLLTTNGASCILAIISMLRHMLVSDAASNRHSLVCHAEHSQCNA